LIIGRGGETIKSLQSRSGVRIQVQNDSETEPGATERIVTLIGNKKATDMAYDLIKEVIDEVHFYRTFSVWFCICIVVSVHDFLLESFVDHMYVSLVISHELKPINRPDGPSATNQWSFFAFPTSLFISFVAIPWLIYTTQTVNLFLE
jgi:rRNA processing protein Krr1/Pno1